MDQEVPSTAERAKGFCWLLMLSFILWLSLSSKLESAELVAGGVVCVIVTFFASKTYSKLGLPSFRIKNVIFFLIYIITLFWEIIKANFDVAYRVIHPKMPIKPGIIVIKTRLKSDIAKMLLANSITLTPGTFTVDIIGDELLIHWINVKTEDVGEATNMIGHRFEKYLQVIFEQGN